MCWGVLKERKETQDWLRTSFTQRKMKSFILLFEDLKAVIKKQKKWTFEVFKGIIFCSQRKGKENISRFQYNLGLSVPQWQGEEIIPFKSRWVMEKKKPWCWNQSVTEYGAALGSDSGRQSGNLASAISGGSPHCPPASGRENQVPPR